MSRLSDEELVAFMVELGAAGSLDLPEDITGRQPTGGRRCGAGDKRLKRERGGVFVDVRGRQPKVHVACGSAALNETT